jgi:protein-tyrosine-phosphatase
MAEVLLKQKLKKYDPNTSWRIESAGTWAESGIPATQKSINVMEKRNLDLTSHRSKIISKELLKQFDLVLTMDDGHKESIKIEFPDFSNKVYLLSEMINAEISIDDPMGGSLNQFETIANQIDTYLEKGLKKILRLVNYSSDQI